MDVQDDPIPHSKPLLGREEIEAAAAVIASGHLSQGPQVRRFEQAMAAMHRAAGAVALSSGTAALHLTLLALDVGPGDEVVLPAYACAALSNAVRYTGATPVLADVSSADGNLERGGVEKHISAKTRAVIVPHLFGRPARMEAFFDLGLPIIEDCAQALGAVLNGRLVGSFATAAVFSFYATKMIATGEGGMVVSHSAQLLDRVRDLREYDGCRDDERLRYNYKSTDLQAAIGRVQMQRLDFFIERRRRIAGHYFREFKNLDVELPLPTEGHVYYRFVMGCPVDAQKYIEALAAHHVTAARPVQPPPAAAFDGTAYPSAARLYRRHISIPIYPAMSDDQVQRIIAAVQACFPGKSC